MPIKLVNPYSNDRTRTDTIEKIIEDFIEQKWNNTEAGGINKTDIVFGHHPTDLLQSGKQITLNCFWIYTKRRRMTPDGGRMEFVNSDKIQVYVSDPEKNYAGRDPRAIKILHYLEDLLTRYQGDMPWGIHEIELRESGVRADYNKRNVSVVEIVLDVYYVLDRRNVDLTNNNGEDDDDIIIED